MSVIYTIPVGKPSSSYASGKPEAIVDLFNKLDQRLIALGPDVERVFLKRYINYKVKRSFVTLRLDKGRLVMDVALSIDECPIPDGLAIRDVSTLGHQGLGDTEVTVAADSDIDGAAQVARELREIASARLGVVTTYCSGECRTSVGAGTEGSTVLTSVSLIIRWKTIAAPGLRLRRACYGGSATGGSWILNPSSFVSRRREPDAVPRRARLSRVRPVRGAGSPGSDRG
jgi:predicted transport protein